MKLKALFLITAVIAVVFGVLFLIIPTQVYSWYGIVSNTSLNYMGQLFGAALIAIGLICWQSRSAADSDARKAIIFSMLIANAIGFLVALFAQLSNVVNALGWLTVAIYFFLAIGFGYFQFSRSASA